MPLTLTKTWATGDILTAANLNDNFTNVKNKFAAGITTADLSSSAGILNAQLANSIYEFVVNLEIKPTTAVAPGTSTTVPVAVCGLPGSTSDGVGYGILSATAALIDSGDAAATTVFKVEWGNFTGAANTWTQQSTIISTANGVFTSTTANAMEQLTPTITTNALTLHASQPRFLALFLTTVGANALSAAYSALTVTIKLKRTSGLRA